MKEFVITEPLAQAILNYLGTRPYQEVYQLVQALQQIKPIPGTEPVPPLVTPNDSTHGV